MYRINEIFYSIQGEGLHSGRPVIFCRFAGCNLWNGTEKTKKTAVCKFCDTDFVGTSGKNGGLYEHAEELALKIAQLWPKHFYDQRYVIFTGGEPTLQLDKYLVHACKGFGFTVGIETNGTKTVPENVDWICVSPKPNKKVLLKQKKGNELKLVYPQKEEHMSPECFEDLDFNHFFLQPMNNSTANQKAAADYCLKNPKWKISIQIHKIIDLQ